MSSFDDALTDNLKDAFTGAVLEEIVMPGDDYDRLAVRSAVRATIGILVDNGYLFSID